MSAARSPFEDQEYFDLFICGHYLRVNKAGLPDPRSAEGVAHYEVWRKAFVEQSAQGADIDRASELIARKPPVPWEHLDKLLSLATDVRRAREAEAARSRPPGGDPAVTESDRAWEDAERRWKAMPDARREAWRRRIAAERPDVARLPMLLEAKCIQAQVQAPEGSVTQCR